MAKDRHTIHNVRRSRCLLVAINCGDICYHFVDWKSATAKNKIRGKNQRQSNRRVNFDLVIWRSKPKTSTFCALECASLISFTHWMAFPKKTRTAGMCETFAIISSAPSWSRIHHPPFQIESWTLATWRQCVQHLLSTSPIQCEMWIHRHIQSNENVSICDRRLLRSRYSNKQLCVSRELRSTTVVGDSEWDDRHAYHHPFESQFAATDFWWFSKNLPEPLQMDPFRSTQSRWNSQNDRSDCVVE